MSTRDANGWNEVVRELVEIRRLMGQLPTQKFHSLARQEDLQLPTWAVGGKRNSDGLLEASGCSSFHRA